LYPGSDTFPKSIKGKNYFIDPHLIVSDIQWNNYMCKTIDTVQVRNQAGSVMLEYHLNEKTTYTNIYVIQNNWIVNAIIDTNTEFPLKEGHTSLKMLCRNFP
jgi:formylmethanofuran dehydrogenase subunit D